MALVLSDLDLEAMETINYTIDQVMTLEEEDAYVEASEKLLAIVHNYFDSLMLQAGVNGNGRPLVFIPEGSRV
jgi:hypothetical protein